MGSEIRIEFQYVIVKFTANFTTHLVNFTIHSEMHCAIVNFTIKSLEIVRNHKNIKKES